MVSHWGGNVEGLRGICGEEPNRAGAGRFWHGAGRAILPNYCAGMAIAREFASGQPYNYFVEYRV